MHHRASPATMNTTVPGAANVRAREICNLAVRRLPAGRSRRILTAVPSLLDVISGLTDIPNGDGVSGSPTNLRPAAVDTTG
jgi:hypothetical protein